MIDILKEIRESLKQYHLSLDQVLQPKSLNLRWRILKVFERTTSFRLSLQFVSEEQQLFAQAHVLPMLSQTKNQNLIYFGGGGIEATDVHTQRIFIVFILR